MPKFECHTFRERIVSLANIQGHLKAANGDEKRTVSSIKSHETITARETLLRMKMQVATTQMIKSISSFIEVVCLSLQAVIYFLGNTSRDETTY